MPDAFTPRKFAGWLRQLPLLLKQSGAPCIYCRATTTHRREHLGLCTKCYASIPWIRDVVCPTCGRYEDCPDCPRRSDTPFVLSRSAVRYDKVMKELLARYKYRGDEKLAAPIGAMLGYSYALIQRHSPTPNNMPEYITFVPLSNTRLAERGFNQAEQTARQLAQRMNLPVVDLIERARHTDKQSFKTRSARIRDLDHVFHIKTQPSTSLHSSAECRIYIVDDVYTTGSTLTQCAATIRASFPNAQIFGLMWAR